MSEVCVNQKELAARWKISHRTLERWRWAQEGPRYLKIGGRVVYRLSDVEAFEREFTMPTEDGNAPVFSRPLKNPPRHATSPMIHRV